MGGISSLSSIKMNWLSNIYRWSPPWSVQNGDTWENSHSSLLLNILRSMDSIQRLRYLDSQIFHNIATHVDTHECTPILSCCAHSFKDSEDRIHHQKEKEIAYHRWQIDADHKMRLFLLYTVGNKQNSLDWMIKYLNEEAEMIWTKMQTKITEHYKWKSSRKNWKI